MNAPRRFVFQVNLRMLAQPQRAAEAVRTLRSLRIAAQVERGFIASRIYQVVDDPDSLCLQEDWATEAELKSHIRSSAFTELLLFMETAPQAPVLEIRYVSKVTGLEYVEAVRFGDD